jgi:hypothetical protein
MHWKDKLGHMRHETWKERAEYARKKEGTHDAFLRSAEWRDRQVRTEKELRELQDENRQLKDRKFKLQVQLKHKRPTATPVAQTVTETHGWFGKSEEDWKKEYEHWAEVSRVRFLAERSWRDKEEHVLDEIASLKQKNENLRIDIRHLEDELERLTSMSTNLYFNRPAERHAKTHTPGALGWRAALQWRH